MLGREPKDFDVVTNARPEEIRKLFHSACLIGRRFRLAHVRFGREIIEVSTFRALMRSAEGDGEAEGGDLLKTEEGRLLRDNVFGTQEEDAIRRDFTVNALYYDIRDRSVIDYVGGAADLRAGVLRVIGDAQTRYREDPVRMVRAVRFAARLGFRIEEQTAAPIREGAALLSGVPPARMFEEVLKLFHGGYAVGTYELLRSFGLFRYMFPLTEQCLEREEGDFPITLVARALANTDARVGAGKPVTPAFLFAALLWEPARFELAAQLAKGLGNHDAFQRAVDHVLREQLRAITLPKRFSVPMREIWAMQSRLEHRAGRQAFRLLEHPRFRAAYDFLLLRSEVGEAPKELGEWWTRFQEADEAGRHALTAQLEPSAPAPGKRRRRRGRRTSKPEAEGKPLVG